MLNIENVYTFGCSFTYGAMLEDCLNSIKQPPSKYAWPAVLGKMLNTTVHNLADPGSSNKQILFKILNTKFLKNSLVIIHWSFFNRYCILSSDITRTVQIGIWLPKINNVNKFFYKKFYNENDMILDSIFRMNYAKQHLDNSSLVNLHLKMDDIKTFPDWNNVDFLDISMQQISSIYPKAIDEMHPGTEAHCALAELIYKYIQSLN